MWLKSDLRVMDNPALSAAMSNGPTLAVYFLSEKQWHEHGISPAKKSLILRQLKSLGNALKALNVPLMIYKTDTFETLSEDLFRLTETHSICGIYCNKEYELNERLCEQEVERAALSQGVSFQSFNDCCLVEPGRIRNLQGQPYKVFSAFKRAFMKDSLSLIRPLVAQPHPQNRITVEPDLSLLIDLEGKVETNGSSWEHRWPAGEQLAHDRLARFESQSIDKYDKHRDIPSIEGTSEISPYLAVGAISTRQCLQLTVQKSGVFLGAANQGVSTWINELIWREFYRHLLFDYPKLCCFKPFKQDTDRLPWRHDEILFDAWKNARTGYPIVDAAMRQLNQTGWMHNRLRMVTAMFLTKHLFIDWRWGESYFMAKLVDGDLASNNGGWQWSASTGVDAVPYFRIFNPTRQSQRFDPDGDFIRHYLPELASLSNKAIHQPSHAEALALGYSVPIVDHRQATKQTKFYFEQLKNDSTSEGGEQHEKFNFSAGEELSKQQGLNFV
jgi:deoxyribodipyrimidine photo-lyase